MGQDLEPLAARLHELKAALGEGMAMAVFEQVAVDLTAEQRGQIRAQVFFGAGQYGEITVGDVAGGAIVKPSLTLGPGAQIEAGAIGINLGRVVYGRDPEEVERRRLTWYLACMAARLRRLPLSAVAASLDGGEGVAIDHVYLLLATRSATPLARGPRSALGAYYDGEGLGRPARAHDPDYALPAAAWIATEGPGDDADAPLVLLRSLLASEAVGRQRRLVLLGGPGSGKSTMLRHLAWTLARRGLDQPDTASPLPGWPDGEQLLPLLLPLRRLAGHVARLGPTPAAVAAALAAELEDEYGVRGAVPLIESALGTGRALLLLDGLDEAPAQGSAARADRLAVVAALRAFFDLYPQARAVLTCRTQALSSELHVALGWPAEVLAPLTLGQIRHFAEAWFAALARRGALGSAQAASYAEALVATISASAPLRRLAASPLLLTMISLTMAEGGELPRDRSLLYEEVLRQLLGAWDAHKGGASFAEAIGADRLGADALRDLLDQLAFAAHSGEPLVDGRGQLLLRDLRSALAEQLELLGVPGAWEASRRCLDYFCERSGLLIPGADGTSYSFAHLTLQEHCAGRRLLLQPGAVQAVMARRHEDRWREPIGLGLGVIQGLYPALADRIDRVLTELIDADEAGWPKPAARWQRDLIFAAELGRERGWEALGALIGADRLRRDLRRGLVALLGDPAQPLPVAERVRAGFLLGELGDPRLPVSLDQWRAELARAGEPGAYFCRLPMVDPGPTRLIARYPITNGQLRVWQREAGLPARRYDADPRFGGSNQPAAGVSWHLAQGFCAWLSAALAVSLRLPSEGEWELAARGGDGRRYPWGDRRLRDRAAAKEDHDLRRWPYTVPVGCYPAGASPVGALDMAGNIWEWNSDLWTADEADSGRRDHTARVLRGGGYLSKKAHLLATARIGAAAAASYDHGFRLLLELPGRPPAG